MEAPKSKWQGLGAIVVVRQSSDKDGTSSTAAQLDYMHKELEKVGLRYVDKEVLDGVPGSAPARISEVLSLKCTPATNTDESHRPSAPKIARTMNLASMGASPDELGH